MVSGSVFRAQLPVRGGTSFSARHRTTRQGVGRPSAPAQPQRPTHPEWCISLTKGVY